MRRQVFRLIDSSSGTFVSRIIDQFLMILIALNVIAVIIETVDAIGQPYHMWFFFFELFSVLIFSLEYVLRLWTAPEHANYRKGFGRLRFMKSPMAIVDFLAVLPFYLPLVVSLDLRFIRALRLFRLFRILKMGRYASSIRALASVFKKKKEEVVITTFGLVVLLILSSSLMYHVEHSAQPEAFSSIPSSMWWAVATLTTVGYGDVYPITQVGKVMGAFIAVLGIGFFALPTGILASGFTDELSDLKKTLTVLTVNVPYMGNRACS